MRIAGYLVLGTVLLSAAASAQTTVVPGPNRIAISPEQRDSAVRAQVSVQIVVPSAADDASAEAEKAREDARKAMYELAGHECALLLAVLAAECRLENVNVNVSRQTGARAEGFTVRGSMTYRIVPK